MGQIQPDMIALDGNAIAGDLIEVLGVDLAAAKCACASCGTAGFFAEAVVYKRGPGRVARCSFPLADVLAHRPREIVLVVRPSGRRRDGLPFGIVGRGSPLCRWRAATGR